MYFFAVAVDLFLLLHVVVHYLLQLGDFQCQCRYGIRQGCESHSVWIFGSLALSSRRRVVHREIPTCSAFLVRASGPRCKLRDVGASTSASRELGPVLAHSTLGTRRAILPVELLDISTSSLAFRQNFVVVTHGLKNKLGTTRAVTNNPLYAPLWHSRYTPHGQVTA